MHSSASLSFVRSSLRWTAAVAVMALLFLWWPYKIGQFSEKVSVFADWAQILATNQTGEWLFCPFVPLISLALAWRSRAQLETLPLRGHASGLGILLVGGFVFWFGYRADSVSLGFAATQIVLAGLIVWLCGWVWMWVLIFPWMFLVFMWPNPYLDSQLAVPMRVIAASLTAKLLSFMDLAAVSRGTAVFSAADLPNAIAEGARFKLDVAAACSGLRSLYALLMLAAFSGYWFLRRSLPRGVLLLSALPLALAGNIVRLVLLAFGAVWLGEEFAVGKLTPTGEETSWFHQLAGVTVFAVALAGMFGLCSLLERARWNRNAELPSGPGDRAGDDSLRVTVVRAMVAMTFGGAVLGFCASAGNKHSPGEAGVTMDLPRSIGQAQGTELPITDLERGAGGLPADVTMVRMMYTSRTTLPTQVAVVLDGVAGRGLHQPEACAVGQGWRILDERVIKVQVAGREIDATMLRLFMNEKDPPTGRMMRRRGIHVFWFQSAHGVAAADHFGHVFMTHWESAFRNVKHRWALVSFSTYLPADLSDGSDGFAESTALADLQGVIAQVGPTILKP